MGTHFDKIIGVTQQAELSDNLKLIAKLYGDRDNQIKGMYACTIMYMHIHNISISHEGTEIVIIVPILLMYQCKFIIKFCIIYMFITQ